MERANLAKLEGQKSAAEEEIQGFETSIAELRKELEQIQETLEEKNKAVDVVKKTTGKAAKVLDLALKEIANWVSHLSLC